MLHFSKERRFAMTEMRIIHRLKELESSFENLVNIFNIEKDCKNEAYSFIVANGLFDDFKKFHEHYKGVDHHKSTVEMLIADAEMKDKQEPEI